MNSATLIWPLVKNFKQGNKYLLQTNPTKTLSFKGLVNSNGKAMKNTTNTKRFLNLENKKD